MPKADTHTLRMTLYAIMTDSKAAEATLKWEFRALANHAVFALIDVSLARVGRYLQEHVKSEKDRLTEGINERLDRGGASSQPAIKP